MRDKLPWILLIALAGASIWQQRALAGWGDREAALTAALAAAAERIDALNEDLAALKRAPRTTPGALPEPKQPPGPGASPAEKGGGSGGPPAAPPAGSQGELPPGGAAAPDASEIEARLAVAYLTQTNQDAEAEREREDQVLDQLDAFLESEALEGDDVDQVHEIFEDFFESQRELREDFQSEALSEEDATDALLDLRDQVGHSLIATLGEEAADRLHDYMKPEDPPGAPPDGAPPEDGGP